MKNLLTLAALVIATSCFGQEACQSDLDINANGAVDIGDFLHVLGLFGDVDSDGDGVWDSQDLCTNPDACNFQSAPTAQCLFNDAIGVCGGYCEIDSDNDGICDFDECGQPFSYYGFDYATVLIGEQCWFVENLRTLSYSNGESIPSNLTDDEWSTTTEGASSVFGLTGSSCSSHVVDGAYPCNSSDNAEDYGLLYNWYAVNDDRGLCPTNWRIPTELDWQFLELELGMDPADLELIQWRGTDQGTQMKAEQGWNLSGDGSNSSGFTGKPGGYRQGTTGSFFTAGLAGYWWTSTESSASSSWWRYLSSTDEGVWRNSLNKRSGMSIRCIQDSE